MSVETAGRKTPEEIAEAVLTAHAIRPDWNRTGEQIHALLVEAARAAQPPATDETSEQIAERVLYDGPEAVKVANQNELRHRLAPADVSPEWVEAYGEACVLAGIQAAWETWEPETAPSLVKLSHEFAPEGEPDEYRDAWEPLTLPNDHDDEPARIHATVNGGTGHVPATKGQVRTILAWLSEQNREVGS